MEYTSSISLFCRRSQSVVLAVDHRRKIATRCIVISREEPRGEGRGGRGVILIRNLKEKLERKRSIQAHVSYLGVSVVPVQLIAEDVLGAMSGLAPLERYFGLPDVDRRQHFRLARYPLLRLDLHRQTEWPGTDARERLHPYRVDRVRR